ncbi:protein-disulfide reductase DsbD domain-containing protein [Liberibacter crescens]|nr:protein-disulfide reductase DsbD domain-containing protein [Liberibacter crescens]
MYSADHVYKIRCIIIQALIFLVVIFRLPSQAAWSNWVMIEGGQIRLNAFHSNQEGIVHGLLEIKPNPQWITYWCFPKETSPVFSIISSQEWVLDKIEFPAPKHFYENKIERFGYDTPVSLPVIIHKKNKESSTPLNLHVEVNFCQKEQCVLLKADFTIDFDKDNKNNNNVEANMFYNARVLLPQQPTDDFRLKQLERTGKELNLIFTLPNTVFHGEIFFVSPKGEVFWKDFQNKQAVSLILNDQDTKGQWLLTVKAGERAMEMPLILD